MSMGTPDRIVLQLRIGLFKLGVAPCLMALMLVLGAGVWGWTALQANTQARLQQAAMAQARQTMHEAVAPISPTQRGEQNLQRFYAVLGNPDDAEQHLRTLFAIAAELGLVLDKGEYSWHRDKFSDIYRHQIVLPLKGPYSVIRQFCEKTLTALPFASLDELTFKREAIGDDAAEASLRLSLYLKISPQATQVAK